jgi:hypothetical protein
MTPAIIIKGNNGMKTRLRVLSEDKKIIIYRDIIANVCSGSTCDFDVQ